MVVSSCRLQKQSSEEKFGKSRRIYHHCPLPRVLPPTPFSAFLSFRSPSFLLVPNGQNMFHVG